MRCIPRAVRPWAALLLAVTASCSDGRTDSVAAGVEAPDTNDAAAFMTKDEIFAAMPPDQPDQPDGVKDAAGLGNADELLAGAPSVEELIGSERMEYDVGPQGYASDVDLRRYDTPVKSQAGTPWCTAFGTVAAIENLARQKTGTTFDLSETHLWSRYQQYRLDRALSAAQGAYVVAESIWGFRASKPNADLERYGVVKLAGVGQRVTTFSGMLQELQAGRPVAMAYTVLQGLDTSRAVMVVNGRESNIGHAIAVVGALHDSRYLGGGVLIIKNSWGRSAGDKGYFYMPFEYCRKHSCQGWAITGVDVKGASLAVEVDYGAKEGRYMNFRLQLRGPTETLAKVKKVVYNVHSTFGEHAKAEVTSSAMAFATDYYKTYATGWRTGDAVVHLEDGSTLKATGATLSWP